MVIQPTYDRHLHVELIRNTIPGNVSWIRQKASQANSSSPTG